MQTKLVILFTPKENKMLKGIPKIISPDLIKTLMEMGHGDEIALVDGNFPAASMAKRLVRLDGHDMPGLLEAVLEFFPLDAYVDKAAAIMAVVPGDTYVPKMPGIFRDIIATHDSNAQIEEMERFAFYQRAKNAYAIVATGEIAQYANIILIKGIV